MKKVIMTMILVAIALPAWGQDGKENYQSDMKLFIDHVGKVTGKTIMYDSTVLGKKVYLSNFHWKSKEELFRLFLSVMEYNNYILETVGGDEKPIIKVKRNIQGPWTPTPTLFSIEELKKIENSDSFITMVMPLKHVSAREIQTTLRALRIVNPQGGNLAGIEGANCILITDFAPNVMRICQMIEKLDTRKTDEKKAELTRENTTFAIEGQNVPVYFPGDMDVFLDLYMPEAAVDHKTPAWLRKESRATALITNADSNVIVQADTGAPATSLWLTPHLKKNNKIQVKLRVLSEGRAKIQIKAWAVTKTEKKQRYELWNFAVDRPLPAGKTITFSLNFQK